MFIPQWVGDRFLYFFLAAVVLAATGYSGRAVAGTTPSSRPHILYAKSFGVVGDGHTNDGPAILKMLADAATISGPVELKFPEHKTFYIDTGKRRYAFFIHKMSHLTIDGGHSIFMINGHLRFMKMTDSKDISVKNLDVDYFPLPFADGLVIHKNRKKGYVDVRIVKTEAMPPLGGPTHRDGEQAYFSAFWPRGRYSHPGDEYYNRELFFTANITQAYPGSVKNRVVRVFAAKRQMRDDPAIFKRIKAGVWHMSVPVRGIADCYGPGATFAISHNTNVRFGHVCVWSAPWIAFTIINNSGYLLFTDTNVVPKPHTMRLTSSWRDGFHLSNNRATIRFDKCTVRGTSDDAFNLNTLASGVRKVISDKHIIIQPNFPLTIAPMKVGDKLEAYNFDKGKMLGSGRILHVIKVDVAGERTPEFDIKLDRPLKGVQAGGTLIWNATASNPNTILDGCRVDESCRFRSSVTIENSVFNALALFTGGLIEAPLPSDVVVTNCKFYLGQGNPTYSIVVNAPTIKGKRPSEPVLKNFLFSHDLICGGTTIGHARHVVFSNSRFISAKSPLQFSDVADVLLDNCWRGSGRLRSLRTVHVAGQKPHSGVHISNKPNHGSQRLVFPWAHWYTLDGSGHRVRYYALRSIDRPSTVHRKVLGGRTFTGYRVPLPATRSRKATVLSQVLGPKYHAIEFDSYVPSNVRQAISISVAMSATGRLSPAKPIYNCKLAAGRWQRHRITLKFPNKQLRCVTIRLASDGGNWTHPQPVYIANLRALR